MAESTFSESSYLRSVMQLSKETKEQVNELELQDSQTTVGAQASGSSALPWKTTFLRLAPLTGIACMLAAGASIVAALGILMGSRGAAVTTWSVPPSTYLAICTAIANQALRFAAFQGLAIAWWTQATRGSTLAQMHRSWRAGMTAGGALIAGRNMGLIGLACLCSTLVAVDGPLLQKGTTIETAPFNEPPVVLNYSVAPEIMTDATGGWYKLPLSNRASFSFNETVPSVKGNVSNLVGTTEVGNNEALAIWFKSEPIETAIYGCPANRTCMTTMAAPAVAATSCTTKRIPVNYWNPIKDLDNVRSITNVAPPLSTVDFIIDMSLVLEEKESLNLFTGFGQGDDNCVGIFEYSMCTLEAAVGEYNVTITDGNKVTLADAPPRIVALANNTRVNHQWDDSLQSYPSTLAGITQLFYQKYETVANYYFQDGVVWQTGMVTNVYPPYADLGRNFREETCWWYKNPQADVLNDLNRLMFIIGVEVGKNRDADTIEARLDSGLSVHRTILGHIEGTHNVFYTNLEWWAAAAVVELICIALILPTYYGWWSLGRSVSFSPLEVAKAFEAPLLNDCSSNSAGSNIAKAVGDVRIQYGSLSRSIAEAGIYANQTKLAFADPTLVARPQQNEKFDT